MSQFKEASKNLGELAGKAKSSVSKAWNSFKDLPLVGKLLIFIAVLMFLSLFSRRCCPCPEKIRKAEKFDDIRRPDSYLPNYVTEVQRRCLPGESDDGRYCVKEGCPPGMERGSGSGGHLCYPRCIDGYDSNGMSRCYKKCPAGFSQNETTCNNPGHTFAKDVVPCKGCIPPNKVADSIMEAHLPVQLENHVAPIIMTPTTEAIPIFANLPALAPIEYAAVSPYYSMTEFFEGGKASAEAPSAAANSSQKPQPTKTVSVNLSEPRIDDPELPCPRGYTLSGDLCHENCPPHYRDTLDGNCVKPPYVIDRDSYDRGSGVPYITKRLKWNHVFHT